MNRIATAILFTALTATAGLAFECFDYSDVLRQQGQVTIAQDDPTELHVVGIAAYSIGANDPFVAVYDLSDPTQPLELASLALPAVPTGLASNDDWLLVTVPDLGLVRYDLTNPLAPVADDTLDLGIDLPDVALAGELAAVSTVGGVRVIGLDFPFGMLALGYYATESAVNAVAISGNRLYLATYGSGLLVLDATDPTWLQPVGAAAFPREADRVTAGHGLAVLVGRGPGPLGFTARVYDVSGDSTPQTLATMEENIGWYYGAAPVITSPERVLVAARGAGVYEYRIGDRSVPATGYYPGKHAAYHELDGRFLLLSDASLTVGTTGPFPPAPIQSYGAGLLSVQHADLIYSAQAGELHIVDASDPAQPALLSEFEFEWFLSQRTALGLVWPAVYAGSPQVRIDIIDVQDPSAPTSAGIIDLQRQADGIVADDGVLYVLQSGWGIRSYDVADPFNPVVLGSFGLDPGSVDGVVVLGDHLLVGSEGVGVRVYDIADPTAIHQVDTLLGRVYVSDLAVAGQRLLVTDRVEATQVWERPGGVGEWALLGEIPASRVVSAATSADVGYLLHEFGEVVMLDLRASGVPPIVSTLPTRFAQFSGVLANDDWVSVWANPYHRFYPHPCLSDLTAAPLPQAHTDLALTAAPNPFNPVTRLRFMLDRAVTVQLRVYDLRGHLVDTLVDGPLAAGLHTVDWDGRDAAHRALPSGVYHVRLTAAGATVSRKVSLLK